MTNGRLTPAQDLGEEHPRHRNLGQLERDVAAVADDLGTDLDYLLPQRGQRPATVPLGQGRSPFRVMNGSRKPRLGCPLSARKRTSIHTANGLVVPLQRLRCSQRRTLWFHGARFQAKFATASIPALPRITPHQSGLQRTDQTSRLPACQGWGRGFESHRPLQFPMSPNCHPPAPASPLAGRRGVPHANPPGRRFRLRLMSNSVPP